MGLAWVPTGHIGFGHLRIIPKNTHASIEGMGGHGILNVEVFGGLGTPTQTKKKCRQASAGKIPNFHVIIFAWHRFIYPLSLEVALAENEIKFFSY